MFEAWVLVCVAPAMQECFFAQDSYGPYAEEEKCVIRAYEMRQQIVNNLPMHIPVDYRCLKLQGEDI